MLHKIIFTLSWLALFIDVSAMDNADISLKTGIISAVIIFISMIFSGIRAGLLQRTSIKKEPATEGTVTSPAQIEPE